MAIGKVYLPHETDDQAELSKAINLLKKEGCSALIFNDNGTLQVYSHLRGNKGIQNSFAAITALTLLSDDAPIELQIANFNWCLKSINTQTKEFYEPLITAIKNDFKEYGYAD